MPKAEKNSTPQQKASEELFPLVHPFGWGKAVLSIFFPCFFSSKLSFVAPSQLAKRSVTG